MAVERVEFRAPGTLRAQRQMRALALRKQRLEAEMRRVEARMRAVIQKERTTRRRFARGVFRG